METAQGASRTDAFVRLLAQHQRGVYALILSLVPDWADADEILQETNVRLWEQFDKYVPGTDFGAWARTIAKFQVMTYRRRKGRERCQFSSQFIDRLIDEAEADATAAGAPRHEALSECLERLPPKNRELVRDYYSAGAGGHDVAVKHGRSIESIRLTLFRIRRALRDCIDRRVDAGGRR